MQQELKPDLDTVAGPEQFLLGTCPALAIEEIEVQPIRRHTRPQVFNSHLREPFATEAEVLVERTTVSTTTSLKQPKLISKMSASQAAVEIPPHVIIVEHRFLLLKG